VKTLADQLANYAAYHRSQRNIATHLVGIPLIVLAVVTLLSRPTWMVGGWPMSPAVVVAAVTLLYYLRLNVALGLVMTALFGLALWFGAWAAGLDTAAWLAVGIGGFVIGWVFQFVGHHFEGRKPAFVDDLVGLVIGPLFVVAEVLFHLGAFAGLKRQIEQRAGVVRA
jgi:uncharacterized membrane protein YGL010W